MQRNGRIDELKTEIVELQQQLDICQQKSSSDVSQIQTDLDNALADRCLLYNTVNALGEF